MALVGLEPHTGFVRAMVGDGQFSPEQRPSAPTTPSTHDIGVPEVTEMAKRLGTSSAWVASPEIHGTSYALGAQEVSPLDMAPAYRVFATNGLRNLQG